MIATALSKPGTRLELVTPSLPFTVAEERYERNGVLVRARLPPAGPQPSLDSALTLKSASDDPLQIFQSPLV